MIFGNVDCYKCGSIVDAEGCKKRTIEVETGRAGGSWTIGKSSGGSKLNSNGSSRSSTGNTRNSNRTSTRKSGGSNIRYNTGRTFYKKIDVFICSSCLEQEAIEKKQSEDFWFGLIFVAIIGGILYASCQLLLWAIRLVL